MKRLNVTLILIFLVVAIAFMGVFLYQYMTVDRTAPVITCDGGSLTLSVTATDAELCTGLTATDNVDGEITDRIIVRGVSRLTGSNTAYVSYVVFDSSSNFCTFSREVTYTDYQAPRFALSAPMLFDVGSKVTILDRLTATDVIDGDITDRVHLTQSDLATGTEGSYRIQLQVSNSTGDTSVVNLTVLIENRSLRHPQIELSEYLVYVERGQEYTAEDFRSYLVSVLQTRDGREGELSDVTVTGTVDGSRRGCYDVAFSYTNQSNYTSTVILTVVVE